MGRRLAAETAFARSLVRAGRRDRPSAGVRERALERALPCTDGRGRSRSGWGSSHLSAAVSLTAVAFVLAMGTRASAADAHTSESAGAPPGAIAAGSAGGGTLESRSTSPPGAAVERASSLDGPPAADRGGP
jgi:hypothetical protein